jgi:hypothetical protein
MMKVHTDMLFERNSPKIMTHGSCKVFAMLLEVLLWISAISDMLDGQLGFILYERFSQGYDCTPCLVTLKVLWRFLYNLISMKGLSVKDLRGFLVFFHGYVMPFGVK